MQTPSNTLSFNSLGSGAELRSELLEPGNGAQFNFEAKCGGKSAESKSAEAKCGEGEKAKAKTESKSAEAKCGEGKKEAKAKSAEAKKEAKAESKSKEAKCGEGKCGE